MARVKFTTYVEVEVVVTADVDPGVAPRMGSTPEDSDPGDPGGCELEAVMAYQDGKTGSKDHQAVNLVDYLPKDALDCLVDQATEKLQDDMDAAQDVYWDAKIDEARGEVTMPQRGSIPLLIAHLAILVFVTVPTWVVIGKILVILWRGK